MVRLDPQAACGGSFHFWGALSPNPVWHSQSVMRTATKMLLRRGRVLNLFWHSSEMLPGGSPNIPDKAADALYQKIYDFLHWLRENYDAMGVTAAEFRTLLRPHCILVRAQREMVTGNAPRNYGPAGRTHCFHSPAMPSLSASP